MSKPRCGYSPWAIRQAGLASGRKDARDLAIELMKAKGMDTGDKVLAMGLTKTHPFDVSRSRRIQRNGERKGSQSGECRNLGGPFNFRNRVDRAYPNKHSGDRDGTLMRTSLLALRLYSPIYNRAMYMANESPRRLAGQRAELPILPLLYFWPKFAYGTAIKAVYTRMTSPVAGPEPLQGAFFLLHWHREMLQRD